MIVTSSMFKKVHSKPLQRTDNAMTAPVFWKMDAILDSPIKPTCTLYLLESSKVITSQS